MSTSGRPSSPSGEGKERVTVEKERKGITVDAAVEILNARLTDRPSQGGGGGPPRKIALFDYLAPAERSQGGWRYGYDDIKPEHIRINDEKRVVEIKIIGKGCSMGHRKGPGWEHIGKSSKRVATVEVPLDEFLKFTQGQKSLNEPEKKDPGKTDETPTRRSAEP